MNHWRAAILSSLVLAAMGTAFAQDAGKKKDGERTRRTPRADTAPGVGDVAPAIKLKSLDGKQSFDLTSLKGKRPVVLFFGSYT